MTPSPDRDKAGDLPSPLSMERAMTRREFRRHSTEAEKKLWNLLRSRSLAKYKFRRQHPIGIFVADFCCLEKRLVIELDGSVHQTRKAEDVKRTHLLEDKGFQVIRFWNSDVISNPEHVSSVINKALGSIHRSVSGKRAAIYSWTSPLHIQGRGDRGEGGI
jgi:very-short-patch-repair endonuclease